MGVNDSAEMLEVAKAECVRLEGEVAELLQKISLLESGRWARALATQPHHSPAGRISRALYFSDVSNGWGSTVPEIAAKCDQVAAVAINATLNTVTQALHAANAIIQIEAATFERGDNEEGWPVTNLDHVSEKILALAASYEKEE